MNCRRLQNRAFTLIELLVVIAIIAILAAILFPVFAQAKAAAKTSVSLSNMKQIGLSNMMYYADNDDTRMPREMKDASSCQSWKGASEPYRKSLDIFRDPINSANKFVDGFSDPAVRQTLCASTAVGVAGKDYKVFQRDYYWNNIYLGRWDLGGSMTSIENPADVGDIVEGKELFTDTGPFASWTEDVDSLTSWVPGSPKTGLKWNNSGDKYGDKAENVAFTDGHAKRQAYSANCKVYNNTTDTTTYNFWNFTKSQNLGTGPDQWCSSLATAAAAKFR